ncbi:MAG: porin [Myxococcota bacterium]
MGALPLSIALCLISPAPARGLPEVRAVPYPESAPTHPAQPDPPAAIPSFDTSTPEPAPEQPRPPGAASLTVAGGGKGARWTSGDERFSLGLTVRAQVRYEAELEDESAEQSFLIRRARVKSSGWMFGRDFRYQFELGLSPRDMGMTDDGARFSPLLDWFFEFGQLRDLTVRVGQSKLAYSLTRVQSSGNLQFVDRSPANAEFNLDRDIALDLRSYDLFGLGRLRYFAGVFLGEGRDARGATNFEMGSFGRVEVYPFGNDGTHGYQVDFSRAPRPRLMLGAAYAFVDGATRDRGTRGNAPEDGGTTDMHNVTADASFKMAGLSFLGEGFVRRTRRVAGPSIPAGGNLDPGRDGWGWSGQAGYVLAPRAVEFAARYGETHPLRQSPVARLRQPGAAVSYYVLRHALKFQFDYHATLTDGAPGHLLRLQFQGSL